MNSGIPALAGLNLFDPLAYLMAMAFFTAMVALSILSPGRRAIRINSSQALQMISILIALLFTLSAATDPTPPKPTVAPECNAVRCLCTCPTNAS